MSVENNRMTFFRSLKHKSRMEFFRQNPVIQYSIFAMIFIAHVIGFFMNNFGGFVLAFSLSCIAYFFSPYVVTRMRAGGRSGG